MSADVDTLSFEAARAELEAVVERLESGSATLEESLLLWERGETLHRRCKALLDDAQARLDALRAMRPSAEAATGAVDPEARPPAPPDPADGAAARGADDGLSF